MYINSLRIDSRFTCKKMHVTGMEGGISIQISYHHNIRMSGYLFFTRHMKIDLYEALDDASMRTEEPIEVD